MLAIYFHCLEFSVIFGWRRRFSSFSLASCISRWPQVRKIFSCVYLCSSDFVDTLSNETSSEVQEGLDDILTRMKGRVFAQIHTFLLKLLRKFANRRNLYFPCCWNSSRWHFFSWIYRIYQKKSMHAQLFFRYHVSDLCSGNRSHGRYDRLLPEI